MNRFWGQTFFCGICFCTLLTPVAKAESEHIIADVTLRGGTLLDGSGNEGKIGDVAIRGDKIVAVGKFTTKRMGREIDCRGLVIAPGFIDLHTHSDDAITKSGTRANVNYLTQGCTTIVTGNCGFGPVHVADYFKKIEASGAGTHVIHMIPHGSLRAEIMGKANRAPTADELTKMIELAEKGMHAGAFGMTTGLIYIPGTFSQTDELIEVAKVIGKHGGFYASHIRNEGSALLDSVDEILRIGREANLPTHVSHFKATGKNAWGTLRVAADAIEKARLAGQKVTADQYPYIASSTSLEATLLPAWAREGGRSELEKRLRDDQQRAKIQAAVEKALASRNRIQIAGCDRYPEWIGKSLDEVATLEKRSAAEIVIDIESKGGARVVNFGMNEDDVRYGMSLPWVATASDGRAAIPDKDQPHPRSFGTFSRKIGHYAIEQKVVALPQAVRSASGLPADILSIKNRGYLKENYVADIVVFDPQTFRDRATYDAPYQYSTGVRHVFVAGTAAVSEGIPTGALAGQVIRRTPVD